MALKFIKEEIIYFGGDSNKITIFGQSAGSHSVSSHTYSPLSQSIIFLNLKRQFLEHPNLVLNGSSSIQTWAKGCVADPKFKKWSKT